jgi:hypothetical protein
VIYPPNLIRDGNLIPGTGSGTYSTGAFWDGNAYRTRTVTIEGSDVLYGETVVQPQPPVLVQEGYWAGGYWIPGYWIPDYWTGGYWQGGYFADTTFFPGYVEDGYWENGFWEGDYYDSDGNWVPLIWNQGTWHDAVWHPDQWIPTNWITETWNPGTWMPEQWVNGTWVESYWVPDQWDYSTVSETTQFTEHGTYGNFQIHMDSGTPIIPAGIAGRPWTSTPQLGFPAFRVDRALWTFQTADEDVGYDYFTPAAGDGYLWVTSAFYGGYDPQLGSFGGTNSNGYFRDYVGSSVRVVLRNSDGSWLSIGTPFAGPPQIWSNGVTFHFLTTDPANGADIYLSEDDNPVIIQPGGVVGLVSGTYAGQTFAALPISTFAAKANGDALPEASVPLWGPPALSIGNALWKYRGSMAQTDYYGGDHDGQILSVASTGAVSLSDLSLGYVHLVGYYQAGVFSNLPVAITSVTPDGQPWAPAPADPSVPPMIVVDGQAWRYSAALSSPGVYTYVGPQGQEMVTIAGTRAVYWNPATNTYLVGTYGQGTFSIAGKTVLAANLDGTPYTGGAAADGTLDITGNALTLGTWLQGGASLNGLTISFTPGSGDQPSWLRFDAVKPGTDWIWRNAEGNSANVVERVRVTSDGKLGVGTSNPSARLHVAGDARFDGVVHVAPGGDVPMFQP